MVSALLNPRKLKRTDSITKVLEDLAVGEQLVQKYKDNQFNAVKVTVCRLQQEGRGVWDIDSTGDIYWIVTRKA